MNVCELLFVFYLHVSYTTKSALCRDVHSGLTLIHHFTEDDYNVCDIGLVKSNESLLSDNTPATSLSIAIGCGFRPIKDDAKSTPILFTPVIRQSVRKINKKICRIRPAPALIPVQGRYMIGFIVWESKVEFIQKRLPTFKNPQKGKGRFPLIWLHFDRTTWHTSQTQQSFFLYRYFSKKATPCRQYTSAIRDPETLIINEHVDFQIYYKTQQCELLQMVELPEAYKLSNSYTLIKSCISTPSRQLFVQHQLTPIDDFTDNLSREATCFSINTVPLWYSVSTGPMKRVEDFIRKVAHTLPINTLHVITKTHQILQLKNKTDGNARDIYLNDESQRIPVPRFVLKFITYRIQSTPDQKRYIVIAVTNEPFPQNNLNGEDICEETGWEITQDEKERKFISCRSPDNLSDILQESDITFEPNKVFNLREIPTKFNLDEEIEEIEDITDKIAKL